MDTASLNTGNAAALPDKALLRQLRARAEKQDASEPAFKFASRMELTAMVTLALALALMIHANIFQLVRVEGASMEPNFWTNERVFVDKLIYGVRMPQRGEVLICRYDIGRHKSAPIIKRVIALPGETVSITDGVTYINGEPIDESDYYDGIMDEDMPELTVPEAHVFVMGDNRPVSHDSRAVGPVRFSNVMGKARWILWPLSKFGSFPE